LSGDDQHPRHARTVKELKAAGFNYGQAEAATRAVAKGRDIDLSNLATKADLATHQSRIGRTESGTHQMVGIGCAQIAAIITIFKLFSGTHP